MRSFSPEFEQLKMPPIVAVSEMVRQREEEFLARTGEKLVHFERGDVDFETPVYISRALTEAVEQGNTRYPRPGGIAEFKQAVMRKMCDYNGVEGLSADNIVCTNGSQEALGLCLQLFRGGHGAGFTPCWSCVLGTLTPFYGIDFTQIPLAGDFSIDFRQIEDVLARVDFFYFNNPGNPTGRVFNGEEVSKLSELCRRHEVCLISDEAYEYIVYDGSRHVSPLALGGEHVIGIHSFSKTYAMTGWRLGYTVSRNDKVNRLLTLGNFAQTAGVTTFLQHAAAAALNDTETGAESIRGMVMEYRKRRDLLYEGLSAINGIRLAKPGGAFYLFPDCSELIPDQCTGDERETYIFRRLLDHGVAVVPGKSFGTGCEEYVRLAYSCTPLPAIETALKRIRTALG